MFTEMDTLPGLDPSDAAEEALAALKRMKLVRSWSVLADGTYDVLVGRGTVDIDAMTADGVLDLAAALIRDRVRIVSGGYSPMGHAWTRSRLSDGRYLDRHDSIVGRGAEGCRYSVCAPGADASGSLAVSLAARTEVEALALAGLRRVRGRCRCGHLRPLSIPDNGRWQPDPMIPCPNCQADSTTTVTLLCHSCGQPIVPRASDSGSSFLPEAWWHVDTRNSSCRDRARLQ